MKRVSDNIITVDHLKKYFDTPYGKLHAVDDVSFTIARGTTLGIVGESGCGKSTLGRTIIGLTKATAGDVIYDGVNLKELCKKRGKQKCRNMQIIFQDPYASLDPRLSVFQLIAEPLKTYRLCSTKDDYSDRVERLMEQVGVDIRFINSYPHELDGGRRQRIGVARALALEPKFIVCDEPVSALDVSIQAQIINLMMDLQDKFGLTYMFITHDLSAVKHISDEIGVMYLGRMVEKTSSDALFESPIHPYTKALLHSIPVPDLRYKGRKKDTLKGEVGSPVNPGENCRFAGRCKYAQDICRTQNPTLTDRGDNHFVACHCF